MTMTTMEDEEAEDEEPEIEWTPRKRQLNLCGVGLLITIGVFAILILFTATLAAFLDWFTWGVMGLFQDRSPWTKSAPGRRTPGSRRTSPDPFSRWPNRPDGGACSST